VTALGPGEIRARRRPFVVLGIAGLRILAGFCLAWPLASLISTSGVGLRPEGDRALFEGGGYLLLELLRLQGGALAAAARGLVPVLVLALVLTAASNAALLVALNSRERLTVRGWLARALDRVPALLVLGAGTALGQLVLVVAGVLATGAVPEPLAKPVATTLAQAALWLVVGLSAGALGGFADVVKASLVRHESRLVDGLARAFRCLRHSPIRASFGWFPCAFAFLVSALAAAALTESLDVSRSGAWRVGAVLLVHQLVIVVSVAARAAWFARALRMVATDPQATS
jgi:hypothetical protein